MEVRNIEQSMVRSKGERRCDVGDVIDLNTLFFLETEKNFHNKDFLL